MLYKSIKIVDDQKSWYENDNMQGNYNFLQTNNNNKSLISFIKMDKQPKIHRNHTMNQESSNALKLMIFPHCC